MDKIKEVMGLVARYGAAVSEVDHAAIVKEFLAIESKLRELLEREPLSDDRIETLFMSTELECMSSDDIEDAITFARLIEVDHGIGNDSKVM